MTEHSLTFREFPALLMDLISSRDTLLEIRDFHLQNGPSAEIERVQQDLDGCEIALRECITELVKKADGYVSAIRFEEAGAKMAREEAARCQALAQARTSRVEWLKSTAIEVMRALDVKRIPGETSELHRQTNGGAQPVEVRQPELLPAKYQRWEIRMTGDMRAKLIRLLIDDVECDAITDVIQAAKSLDADSELIRKDLLAGEAVPGAILQARGEHLRIK